MNPNKTAHMTTIHIPGGHVFLMDYFHFSCFWRGTPWEKFLLSLVKIALLVNELSFKANC